MRLNYSGFTSKNAFSVGSNSDLGRIKTITPSQLQVSSTSFLTRMNLLPKLDQAKQICSTKNLLIDCKEQFGFAVGHSFFQHHVPWISSTLRLVENYSVLFWNFGCHSILPLRNFFRSEPSLFECHTFRQILLLAY
jgi:hypothetical protein